MKRFFTPTTIRITIFLGLGLVAAFSVSEWALDASNNTSAPRAPASIHSSHKHQHSHNVFERDLPIRHTEKLLAPVVLLIEPVGSLADGAGEEFELKVMIKSRYDLSSLETEWVLPEGVELVSGAMKDTQYSMAAEEVRTLHAVFKQNTDSNEQVHFRVKSLDSKLPFGASVQYNTLDQEDIDKSVAALEERAREYMKKQNAKMVE